MAKPLFVLSTATIASVFVAIVAVATPGSLQSEGLQSKGLRSKDLQLRDLQSKDVQLEDLRLEVYRYYVQGHQQGRADAMAGRSVREFSKVLSLQAEPLQGGSQREYMRGYRDGYHLIER